MFHLKTIFEGTSNYCIITLHTEFLDESDMSLAYAIYGSSQMSSFPVAIIQVSVAVSSMFPHYCNLVQPL